MGVFEEVMQGLDLTPRIQQVKLVELARVAVQKPDQRFVQAGTGTGKSFALLSVALEASRETGLPSVVVCPNNALIDQYVGKDVFSVRGVAGGRFEHIKGRGRYLCSSSVALVTDPNAQYRFFEMTQGGELEWAKLGLTEDYGCPGSDTCDPRSDCHCGAYEQDLLRPDKCTCPPVCGAFAAKARAEGADVIVTNAHVLVWDALVAKYTHGNAHLLPEYGALFVDECHELEAIGRGCLSEEITSENPICKLVPGLANWIEDRTELLILADKREEALDRSPELLKLATKAKQMADDLWNSTEQMTKLQTKKYKRLRRFVDFVEESEDFVSLVDVSNPDKTVLRRKCVNAGGLFNSILTQQPTVLVSGTIPASDRRRLGLPKGTSITSVGHPFDYSKSTLVISKYHPTERTDLRKRIDSAIRAINQTKGGTLILFTSWADLEAVTPLIEYGLNDGIDVYVQSREDPATLPQDIADFRQDGNAVLAGVRSLYTGMDIPGPALRQVIIWKLPWQVPDLEVMAVQKIYGRNVYKDQMLMTLTQGIGRLIRTTEDTGRVLIMDCRAAELDWDSNGMTHHLAEFTRP